MYWRREREDSVLLKSIAVQTSHFVIIQKIIYQFVNNQVQFSKRWS